MPQVLFLCVFHQTSFCSRIVQNWTRQEGLRHTSSHFCTKALSTESCKHPASAVLRLVILPERRSVGQLNHNPFAHSAHDATSGSAFMHCIQHGKDFSIKYLCAGAHSCTRSIIYFLYPSSRFGRERIMIMHHCDTK